MNTLDEWTSTVARELGLDALPDRDQVLDLARDVAHNVARPAAPLTTFLVGLAAGRAGGASADVQRLTELVSTLATSWPAGHDGGDARG